MILRSLFPLGRKPESTVRCYAINYSSYDTVHGMEDMYYETMVSLARGGDILNLRTRQSGDVPLFEFVLKGVEDVPVEFFPYIDAGQVRVHSDDDKKNQDIVQFLSSQLSGNCGLEITLEEEGK